jgi:hypothetical protein
MERKTRSLLMKGMVSEANGRSAAQEIPRPL